MQNALLFENRKGVAFSVGYSVYKLFSSIFFLLLLTLLHYVSCWVFFSIPKFICLCVRIFIKIIFTTFWIPRYYVHCFMIKTEKKLRIQRPNYVALNHLCRRRRHPPQQKHIHESIMCYHKHASDAM